jgi:diguanylate cyclase (GGDEF)-like protein
MKVRTTVAAESTAATLTRVHVPRLTALVRGVAAVPDGDLPATSDPRVSMPRAGALLALAAAPVVLLTASSEVATGYRYSDVLTLIVGLVALSLALLRVPWQRVSDSWLLAIPAIQLVFVATLNTMTGGTGSPYFALYAPILALAGWYLGPTQLLAVVGLAFGSELWRGTVVDPRGITDQVTIALPSFAVVALIAALTARHLGAALVTMRRDQVLTAQTLDGVRGIGARLDDDPAAQLTSEAARVFGARATLVPLPLDGVGTERPGIAADDGYLRAPVAGASGVHGLLQMWRATPFSPAETRLVAILAEAAGRSLDHRRLFERTLAEAERDPLTGLLNRKAFDRDLNAAIAEADATGNPMAVCFIDVDNFKDVNDLHGHARGDAVLARVAGALGNARRAQDELYRVGGDEFALILRATRPPHAHALARRLVGAARGTWRREADPAFAALSASVGVATCVGRCAPGDLVAAADAAMYAAKRAGGDRVVVTGREGKRAGGRRT